MSCPLSRQIQVFTQASCTQLGERRSESVLTINDRVVISRQDGRGWALTMGTITRPMCAGDMEVLVDKAVSASFLYRIDAAPSYGGGVMAGSLADFCTSDSERYTCTCIQALLYSAKFSRHFKFCGMASTLNKLLTGGHAFNLCTL